MTKTTATKEDLLLFRKVETFSTYAQALAAATGTVLKELVVTGDSDVSKNGRYFYNGLANQVSTLPSVINNVPKEVPYQASLSIAYDATQPNINITGVSGNLSITITGMTANSVGGLVTFTKSAGQTVSLVGNVIVSGIPDTFVSLTYVFQNGAVSWYTNNPKSVTSVGTNLLQIETQNYLTAVLAAGGVIDTSTLFLLDKWVLDCKTAGVWSLFKEAYVPLGSNLAASLLKIKYESPSPSAMIKSGTFTEADYDQARGIGWKTYDSNNAKYLKSGFIPANHGINAANGGSWIFSNLSTFTIREYGLLLGFDAGNPPEIIVAETASYTGNAGQYYTGGQPRVTSISGNTTRWSAFSNGSQIRLRDNQSIGTPAYASQILLFNGVQIDSSLLFPSNGYSGGYIMSQFMNDAQSKIANKLFFDLQRAVRTLQYKDEIIEIRGDSITQGVGVTDKLNNRWATKFVKAVGGTEINIAHSDARINGINNYTMSDFDTYEARKETRYMAFIKGTNDANSDGSTDGDAGIISALQTSLTTILTDYRKAGIPTIAGSLPWSNLASAAKLDAYARGTAAACKTTRTPFANNYYLFADKSNPASFFDDGIHTNDAGNDELFKNMMDAHRGRLTRNPLLDFAIIPAQSAISLNVTILNAEVGMNVVITPDGALQAGLILSATVTANDTITVVMNNITTGSIDPVARYFKISVMLNY